MPEAVREVEGGGEGGASYLVNYIEDPEFKTSWGVAIAPDESFAIVTNQTGRSVARVGRFHWRGSALLKNHVRQRGDGGLLAFRDHFQPITCHRGNPHNLLPVIPG